MESTPKLRKTLVVKPVKNNRINANKIVGTNKVNDNPNKPKVFPIINSDQLTPCDKTSLKVPVSRSPAISANPQKKSSKGTSNCKIKAAEISPNRNNPLDKLASEKLTVFCRCASKNTTFPT